MTSLDTAAPPVSVSGLTKRYGDQLAVDDLSFTIAPGRVTGFLGPNGAGKTTTLRMLVGLAAPTAGDALVYGRRYADLPTPSALVGTLIDASGFHPGRRVRHELAIHAVTAGVDDGRIPVVLEEVGLEGAADKRVAHLSLGMRQRLGLAAALLGDPGLLVLDEPANGLDPAGMHWLRTLLRARAAQGTAVLVSSHVLAELALFADDVIVVNHGRLVTTSSVDELVASGGARVFVRSPQLDTLGELLAGRDASFTAHEEGLSVSGLDAAAVGELAAAAGVVLHELRTDSQTLEDVFLELTDDQEMIR
jgi:ABC-2 type transport system ATP-binding protein